MTPHERVYSCLKSTGIPGTLEAYPEGQGPALPFFIYEMDSGGEVYADDSNWHEMPVFFVELYESAHDPELESMFKKAIQAEFGPVSVTDAWIPGEHAHVVTYRFTCAS